MALFLLDNAPYFPNNETHQINGYLYGIFNDILENLQTQLNFSTDLYKRKDSVWGFIYPQSNGTFIGTGNCSIQYSKI